MVVSGKSANHPPEPIQDIKRKTWLKLLVITLWNDVNDLLSRASNHMYIFMRKCRSYDTSP